MNDSTKSLSKVIRIDESEIRGHLDEMVRGTVEETLNAMQDAEADGKMGDAIILFSLTSASGPHIFVEGIRFGEGMQDVSAQLLNLHCRTFAGIGPALLCISVQLATGVTDKS